MVRNRIKWCFDKGLTASADKCGDLDIKVALRVLQIWARWLDHPVTASGCIWKGVLLGKATLQVRRSQKGWKLKKHLQRNICTQHVCVLRGSSSLDKKNIDVQAKLLICGPLLRGNPMSLVFFFSGSIANSHKGIHGLCALACAEDIETCTW